MKIQNKLFFILFTFSLLLVTILALLMQWSINKGMLEYVNTKEVEATRPLIAELASEYEKNNDWSTLKGKNRKFSDLVYLKLNHTGFLEPLPEFGHPPPPMNSEVNQHNLLPPPYKEKINSEVRSWYGIIDAKESLIVGMNYVQSKYDSMPITVDKTIVGYFIIPKRGKIVEGYELDFVEQQTSYLWIFVLITMLLVALLTFPLARYMLSPIKRITKGMHQLTQGQYKRLNKSKRKDELGHLIRDFNELAITLGENESARKRWLANISHELRTPVAILRGELEAMLDNVRPMSAENIESANEEVKQLQFLIDDLHQLTSADIGGLHYRKKSVHLDAWLKSEINKYSSYLAAAGIRLEISIADHESIVFADSARLCQLFENLINNCVNYSQANIVKISMMLVASPTKPVVRVTVEDNGVGVAEQHLAKLFEHLYRVDDSRNRKTGGTGLGLSICAHIVSAHQGTIKAEHSSLGGLAIIMEFPLSN